MSEMRIAARRLIRSVLVALVIAGILLVPPLVSVEKIGIQAVFNFLRQDAFYYLAIADKSGLGFYTFDGEAATTGFHPLWQVLLTGVFAVEGHSSQESQLYAAFWLSVALTIIGYVLAGLAVYRMTGSRLLGILVVPGPFYLVFAFVSRFENSPWSFMNGMESPLSILFGGLLFHAVASLWESREGEGLRYDEVLGIGTILAFIVLARLDDVFAVPAIAGCIILLCGKPLRRRLATALVLCIPTALALGAYFLFNHYCTGTIFPISGIVKGGLAVSHNLSQFLSLNSFDGFPLSIGAYLEFFEVYYRHVQMLFPLLLAVLLMPLVWSLAKGGAYNRDCPVLLIGLLVYVVLKALYNLVNVDAGHQGVSWYYPLSLLTINVVVLIILARASWSSVHWNRFTNAWGAILVGLFLAAHVAIATATVLNVHAHAAGVYRFWRAGDRIAQTLRQMDPGMKLVEIDDGLISYSLSMPAMHGLGFVLDPRGYEAKLRGELLRHAYARGFSVITSLQYVRVKTAEASSEQLSAAFRRSGFFGCEDLDRYHFKVIFIDRETGASFVKFEPKK